MKVNINKLPKGFSIRNGRVYQDGGTTGDQSNFGLVTYPQADLNTSGDPTSKINYSMNPVDRDEANLEAEKGETVLTDLNDDGNFELYEIQGNRHHQGGTPLNLPPQSFIYSDTGGMKFSKYELAEMGLESNKRLTPAAVSKKYQLNNFMGLLDDEHTDKISRDTAEYMIGKNKRSLSQLAFLQEAKKEFEDGVPLASYPYLTEKGIDPIEFSQKVESISRKEAELKMLMQLPYESRMQILAVKEKAQEQQKRQQQQQQLAQAGMIRPSMGNAQVPPPSQQEMPMAQGMPPMGPPQGGMPPMPPQGGGMPPQGMMPPMQPNMQPNMQPAMARYGGQLSNLAKANDGVETDGMKAFRMNVPLWAINGRCLTSGCTERMYDAPHDFSVGLGAGVGKANENYMGDASLWGGYSFNPQRGSGRFRGAQEGVAGYLGANIGARTFLPPEVMETGKGDSIDEVYANAVGTLGLKGEWKPKNDYTAWLTGRDKNPLQYGLGAFYKQPIMGEGNPQFGGYANVGNLNFTAGYTPGSGMNYGLGVGIPIRQGGGEEEFEPHMMYDAETNTGYMARTYKDHLKYKEMGYLHANEMQMRYGGSPRLPEAQFGWIGDAWDSATGAVSDAWDYTTDAVSDAYDYTKGKVNQGIDYLQDEYKDSKLYDIGQNVLDYTQDGLSVLGTIPGVGAVADVANTAISGARVAGSAALDDQEAVKKNTEDLAWNAAAIVPGAGQFATAAKFANRANKANKTRKGVDAAVDLVNVKNQVSGISNTVDNISTEIAGNEGSISDTIQSPSIPTVPTNFASNTTSNTTTTSGGAPTSTESFVDSSTTESVDDSSSQQSFVEAPVEEETMIADNSGSYEEDDSGEYIPQSMRARFGRELPLAQFGIGAMILPPVNLGANILNWFTGNEGEITPYNPEVPEINADNSPVIPNYQQLFNQNQSENLRLMDEYNKNMQNLMANYSASYQSPSLDEQMALLNANGAQQLDDNAIAVWEDHIERGGPPPNDVDINYTQAYKNVHGEDAIPNYETDKDNKGPGPVKEPGITNVYNIVNPEDNNNAGSYVNRNNFRTPNDDAGDQMAMNTPGKSQGLPLDYINTDSPYYVGSQWSFLNGGQPNLPVYKRGGKKPRGKDVAITVNGVDYTYRDLKRMDQNEKDRLFATIDQQKANTVMDEINSMRVDTEGTESTTTYRSSGKEDWIENFKTDTEYQQQVYDFYKKDREKRGKSVLPLEDFVNTTITFQTQNRLMNEEYDQDFLSQPDWDKTYELIPCTQGEDGCNKNKNGNYYKKGETKGANWRYNDAATDLGFDPLDQDMISHAQAGFIAGKYVELGEGDEKTQEYMNTGVADDKFFDGTVSGDDGFWGNTTNRQLMGDKEVTEAVEAVPCSNAEEMQAACTEAGGIWTPYTAAVEGEDGTVTTPASGCECSKEIDVPEKKQPPKETPFWLQDELGIANARDAKLSLRKRYPWAPFYNQPEIDAVYKDPTREIAAIGEQAFQAAEVAKAFGSGAGRGMAAALAAQGKANTAIAESINKVQSDNVTVANQMNIKNAELEYKTQMLNNNEKKQLYDNTVLVEENYDNALRKANAAITAQLQNAYTNRANTANLNSIYPQFDIDPASGGIINITDPKAFNADPNYTDPKTAIGEYASQRDEYFNEFGTYDGFPDFKLPDNSKKGQTTWGQQNNEIIQNAGYNTARRGKEKKNRRILRKGAELRNFFLPMSK